MDLVWAMLIIVVVSAIMEVEALVRVQQLKLPS